MKEVMYNEYAKEALEALSKGAFLSVSHENQDNIMTIGWGNIGYMWKKPVFTAMVRYSRYTYELIEKSDSFTVSIPLRVDMQEALKICGTLSGRDHNKWEKANLTKIYTPKIQAPLVGECDLHYECRIIGKTELTKDMLEQSVVEKCYKNGDYHVLYYGEIVGTYVK